jgi:hypothetical protein
VSRCRSCQAEIVWAVTENGKRVPLDAVPAERPSGLFKLVPRVSDPTPLAVSVSGERVYLSHFATCPNAEQHRRKAAAA